MPGQKHFLRSYQIFYFKNVFFLILIKGVEVLVKDTRNILEIQSLIDKIKQLDWELYLVF